MSRLRSVLGLFVTVAVLVAAGVAGAQGGLFTSDPVDEGMEEVVELCAPEEGEGEEGEPEEGEPEECEPEEEPEGDEPEGDDEGEQEAEVAQAERDAACDAAAGIEESPLPEGGKLAGLDNALSRVLENCKKNLQAPGLLNALERLSENRARKAARDEAKAERKAEREARKAERKAAKGQGGGPGGGGPPPHAGPPGGGGPPGHAKGG